MLNVTIDVNGVKIGAIRCLNVDGPDDGVCTYRCVYEDEAMQTMTEFFVKHNRPDGALALISRVIEELG